MLFRSVLCMLLVAMSSVSTNAETINFNCTGSTTYKSGGVDKGEFDMTLTTSPLDISGPVGPLGLCHLGVEKEDLRKVRFSCEMGENDLTCNCTGGNFILSSHHRLSRLTGKYTFMSTLEKK